MTDLPETVTIRTPLYEAIPRGVHAHGSRDVAFNVRLSQTERDQIKAAADALGMPIAQFMRWVSISAAKELTRAQPATGDQTRRDPRPGRRKML